jgi:hypothetical protein
MNKEKLKENCCTPEGQIKRYIDCKGCDRKPKQETLEEVCKRIKKELDYSEFDYTSFKLGIKYQQERSYSEEEVLQLLLRLQQTESYDNLYEWFEQFKKK